jgi:acetate kinase
MPLPTENLICSTSQDFDVLMDEDMGDLDLGELDLLGLEDACKKHAFHTIAPKQIHLLKEVLNKAKCVARLGIQNNPPIDLKKVVKDLKKRGCKTDLQRIASLGSRLVESGKYAQLTELFSSNTQGSQ